MGPTPLSLTQFTALLRIETARIEDDALRRRAVARYLPPYPVQLVRVDHADHPHYVAWVFALQQVIQGGTGREANFGRPAAGKTGTTQNNADGWFVGYTPTLTAAVWMGFPEGQVPMRNVHGMSVQGGNFPARIWNRFMKAATLASESVDFPEFDEKVLGDGEALDATLGRASVLSPPTAPSSSGRPSATTAPSGTPTTGGTATTDPTPTTAPSATTAPPTTSPPPTTAPGAAGGADPPQ